MYSLDSTFLTFSFSLSHHAVCNEIDQWQSPVPGLTLNLPVMDVVMQVRIPSKNDKPGGSPVKQAQKEVGIAFYVMGHVPMKIRLLHDVSKVDVS